MATTGDDPARASVLVAESVVALARAEIHLALASARVTGVRFLFALTLSALALLLVQAAFAVIALSPVLWSYRPGPTLAALALSLSIALSTSLLALWRWRSFGTSRLAQTPHHVAATDLKETRA